jgi:hypothetical protein
MTDTEPIQQPSLLIKGKEEEVLLFNANLVDASTVSSSVHVFQLLQTGSIFTFPGSD